MIRYNVTRLWKEADIKQNGVRKQFEKFVVEVPFVPSFSVWNVTKRKFLVLMETHLRYNAKSDNIFDFCEYILSYHWVFANFEQAVSEHRNEVSIGHKHFHVTWFLVDEGSQEFENITDHMAALGSA